MKLMNCKEGEGVFYGGEGGFYGGRGWGGG